MVVFAIKKLCKIADFNNLLYLTLKGHASRWISRQQLMLILMEYEQNFDMTKMLVEFY